ARALAEQRVDAQALLASVEAALARDADLLDAAERSALDAAMQELRDNLGTRDHRALKGAVEAMNRASEAFAGRRMDRAVSGALSGRRLDEISP
ncbi:MAG TPA: Fe-S protein assembly chaperone HscA, partial [Usitatibacter sp.]|nr:Fe-S protein assembly chaperone HscA [Usitatibacter sp.]